MSAWIQLCLKLYQVHSWTFQEPETSCPLPFYFQFKLRFGHLQQGVQLEKRGYFFLKKKQKKCINQTLLKDQSACGQMAK